MNLISFVNLLNMSVKGSFVIVAVLIIRLIFRNRSAKERMPLWILVGLRLLIPVTVIRYGFSAVPRQVTYLGETAVSAAIESAERSGTDDPGAGAVVFGAVLVLWIIGVCLMLAYLIVSIRRMRERLAESVMIRPGVWACDRINTPFIFGLGNPKLYVPSFLEGEDLEYVISHEREHIRRHDQWWKPAAFVVLTLHWFNPFVWAAYFAFGRDVELACDEASTCWRGYEERKAYANALINCSSEEYIGVCPVAFGGGNLKGRIGAVMRNATPRILVTLLMCEVVLFGFCSEPMAAIYDYGLYSDVSMQTMKRFWDEQLDYTPGKRKYPYVDIEELAFEKDESEVTVYLWVLYELYHYEDGDVVCDLSQRDAVRVTAEETEYGYEITEYYIPEKEEYKDVFPLSVRAKVIHFDTLAEVQHNSCYYEAAKALIPLYENDGRMNGMSFEIIE